MMIAQVRYNFGRLGDNNNRYMFFIRPEREYSYTSGYFEFLYKED